MSTCTGMSPMPMMPEGSRGYSLLELLLVLSLLAVLLGIALPSYSRWLVKARRVTATLELQAVALRQGQYFSHYLQYGASLDELGYPAASYVIDASGNRRANADEKSTYRIELASVSTGAFLLQAVPLAGQGGDQQCGVLGLDHLGGKSASAGRWRDCWQGG